MSKYIVAVLGCTVAAGLCAAPAVAQQTAPQPLPPVEVQQKKPKPTKAVKKPAQNVAPAEAAEPAHRDADRSLAAAPASSTTITSEAIADKKPVTNDTAQLLSGTPGVNLAPNGGVSSWPDIHGMADVRVRTEVDGMLLSAACPNHMNPVLSYIDPAAVGQVKVYAGITPVSAGGDSIGGTVRVDSAAPLFASGDGTIGYGSLSVFGRSNGNGISASGSVSVATSNVNITYTGSWAKSGDYKDGSGATIELSLYESQNHKFTVTVRDNSNLFVIEGGAQHIPFEGFPSEYMDMTGNDSWFVNTRYAGKFDWGKLDLRAYFQDVRHEMNETAEGGKLEWMGGYPMPMNTHGQNFGYSAKADIPESARDMLRAGSDLHGFLLNDWWPPVAGMPSMSGMMGPGTFWNIKSGVRIDAGNFAEWEKKWSPQWTTLLGVRSDVVWMNTGDVSGYSGNYNTAAAPEATNFNNQNHERTFADFDATALARYEANLWTTYEGGYSMKTRAPSLYELYDWSTHSMAAMMNGWAGDGNMYVGNINLKPETAHTLSLSYGVHDGASFKDGGSLKDSGASKDWELKVTPYYSYVEDYIDVERCTIDPSVGSRCAGGKNAAHNATATSGVVALQYVNQDAEIFGADLYGRMPLARSDEYGKFSLVGIAGYDRGINLATGGGLYHMMPLNAKLTLEHRLGNWSSAAELQLVDNKYDVETVRNELQTPGYALVNLRSSYQWGNVRFDLGVENLFNQQYYSPLGGAYLSYSAAKAGESGTGPFEPLAGMGRNVYAGITVKF